MCGLQSRSVTHELRIGAGRSILTKSLYQNPDRVRTAAVGGLVRIARFDLFSADSAHLERSRETRWAAPNSRVSSKCAHQVPLPPPQPVLKSGRVTTFQRRGYASEFWWPVVTDLVGSSAVHQRPSPSAANNINCGGTSALCTSPTFGRQSKMSASSAGFTIMLLRTRRSQKAFVLVIVGLVTTAVLAALVMLFVYGETNGTLVSSCETRHYLLYVPKSYNRAAPTPLVISLHAFGLTPMWQKQISHWNELADEAGFIVVYPAGTGVPKLWRAKLDDGGKYNIDIDVAFISDLIDELQRKYTIDSKRIYVNGFSNGGGMAYGLYCRLSDRVAAIGMVAGAILLPWDKCHANQPTPVIAFHGTKDPITFYGGGYSKLFKVTFPSIQDWMSEFSRRNMCAGTLVSLSGQP